MHSRMVVVLVAALLAAPLVARGQPKPVELSRLIEMFMVGKGETPGWSLGAQSSTPIEWKTSGVQPRPNGATGGSRAGEARVTLKGKELTNLRTKLEPVPWEIVMSSDDLPRFGPTTVSLSPRCDAVECYFDFEKSVSGLGVSRICRTGTGGDRETGYLLSKGSKQIFVVYTETQGSGGRSAWLTLHFKAPPAPASLCQG